MPAVTETNAPIRAKRREDPLVRWAFGLASLAASCSCAGRDRGAHAT
jgi:hypothetical protein